MTAKYDNRTVKHIIPGVVTQIIETTEDNTVSAFSGPETLYICACVSGNTEYRCAGEYCYISMGDILITNKAPKKCYTSKDYKGFALLVTEKELIAHLPFGITEQDLDLTQIDRALEQSPVLVIRAIDRLQGIIREICEADKPKSAVRKLRTIEMLICISQCEISQAAASRSYRTKAQVELAKSVEALISADLSKHITIEQLSEIFDVSPTRLKNCFKSVYSDSIYSYVRRKKMQKAAEMLTNSSRSILEIAGACGYDNGSKFSKAFRTIYGLSPREYRMSR